MKNKYLKRILIGIILLLIVLGTQSFAALQETSEVYDKWQSLPDNEKEKYIEPLPYTLSIDDSVKMSVFNKFTQGVGSSNLDISSYNLADDIKFEIKNQKSTNECWAFATTSMIETNVAKTRSENIVLSPRHIDYATSKTFLDGENKKGYNREVGMGNYPISLAYCTSGKGPVLETDMPFEDNENKVNLSAIDKDSVLKIENYVKFADILKKYDANGNLTYTDGYQTQYTESQVLGVRDLIKEHIKKYGGVVAYTCLGGDITNNLNIEKITEGKSKVISYYNNDNKKICDHAITIIGWDDNYSKENFNDNCKPINDGAYLVLNSSGGEDNVLSIMYISYDDIYIEYNNYGIISTDDIDYDTIYQHDEYGYNTSLTMTNTNTGKVATTGYIANVFNRSKTEKEEYLNEVSIYISETSNVDIYLNTEDNDKTKIEQVVAAGVLNPGYHTIELSTPLKLTGDSFVVAAKLTSDAVKIPTETNFLSNGQGSNFWDNAKSEAGQSFISLDGESWSDINNDVKDSNICIKAFTTYQEKAADVKVTSVSLNKNSAEMTEGESLTLVATINPSNATNKNIKWTSSDENIAKVSEKGIITAVKEGKVTITATTEDGNKTATCQINIKQKDNTDDDIYYSNEIEGDADITINTNNTSNKSQDTTTAAGIIPQTGVSVVTIIGIIIFVGVALFIFVRIRKMKDIK